MAGDKRLVYSYSPVAHCEDKRLQPRVDFEFRKNVRHVGPHRAGGNVQTLSDLLIPQALGKSLKDLFFAGGKLVQLSQRLPFLRALTSYEPDGLYDLLPREELLSGEETLNRKEYVLCGQGFVHNASRPCFDGPRVQSRI